MPRSSLLLPVGLLALGLLRPVVSIAEPSEMASGLLEIVQSVRGSGSSGDGGSGGDGGSSGDGGDTPTDPETAVRQVYEDDVNKLIVSSAGGCTSSGCHGRAGAPGGLRLYSAAEANNVNDNYASFVKYIGAESADRLTSKISGNSHGGGERYGSGTDEYATIEAWAISVEALP